jgi:hypothetical protein
MNIIPNSVAFADYGIVAYCLPLLGYAFYLFMREFGRRRREEPTKMRIEKRDILIIAISALGGFVLVLYALGRKDLQAGIFVGVLCGASGGAGGGVLGCIFIRLAGRRPK